MRKIFKKGLAITLSAALITGTYITNSTVKAEEKVLVKKEAVYPWTPVEGGTTGDYIADSYEGIESGHVFESVTQERLLDILASEGNYYIIFGGPEHSTTQSVLATINEQAKANGITKIYHFDPYVDGYQIDITDQDTVFKGNNKSVSELWDRIKAALPENPEINNFKGEDTLLFAFENKGGQKKITKFFKQKDGIKAPGPKNISEEIAKVFKDKDGKVVQASERTDFEFFSRNYNGSASFVEQRQDRSENRLGAPVEIFTEDEKENFPLHQVNFNELINILQSPGQHYIFFGTSWCHNTQAIIGSVARKAQANGIQTVYVYDTTLGNQLTFDSEDINKVVGTSSAFNTRNNANANGNNNISYLYGELAKLLGNFRTENNSKQNNSIAYYPNGDLSGTITSVKPWESAEEGTVQNAIRLQLPFLIGYNKDEQPKVNKQWLHANKTEGTEGTYTEYMLELAWVLGTDEAKASTSLRDGLSLVDFAADAVKELSTVLGDKEIGNKSEETTENTTEATTTSKEDTTAKAEDTSKKVIKKASVKKATKKKSAKKISLTLKKVSGVDGYQVKVFKSKKAKKALFTKNITKEKATISSKKFAKKKKLFVKVRGFKKNGTSYQYGAWSSAKAVKIKK
jgi:hypothetical protein